MSDEDQVLEDQNTEQDETPAAPVVTDWEAEATRLRTAHATLLKENKGLRSKERERFLTEHPGLTEDDIRGLNLDQARALLAKASGAAAPTPAPTDPVVQQQVQNFQQTRPATGAAAEQTYTAPEMHAKITSGEWTAADMNEAIRQGRMK